MCGITGFWRQAQGCASDEFDTILQKMAATLVSRGPDSNGDWVDSQLGIALAHRRLAIVDLSPAGHQPMVSTGGRYVITFNGEIYNFLNLRKELEALGHGFSGGSDTEVMLAAFTQWGIESAIQRFRGMFAFALWDRQDRVLYLGRDRIGEKPLYYGWLGHTFVFASELKALQQHPAWQGDIDRDVLALFMRHNCVPSPHSIYKGIYKLPPATFLTIRPSDIGASPQPIPYWSAKDVAASGVANPFAYSETQAIEHLDNLLSDAICSQMLADVPLGAFLSGGVDSSAIVALMQAQTSQPVKTFTIGFHDNEYNEAVYAKDVAKHLGTDHTELYVTPEDALAVIPQLPHIYDEPFSDSSQIPTFLVSQLARQHVTVSLSGDAGDELFGGYNRYLVSQNIWNKVGRFPRRSRKMLSNAITSRSPEAWNRSYRSLSAVLPPRFQTALPGEKLHKLSEVLASPDADAMYVGLASHWKQPESVVLGSTEASTILTNRASWPHLTDFTQRMMYLDLMTYLPDDILVKVDRASMANSLESRVPFLDHRVVEFAWQLPMSMKIRDGQGKWILRQVLYKYVPKDLIERPKMGFGVPIDRWLRGPLREWAEDLLDENLLRQQGFFDPQPIRQKWAEHLSGQRNWQHHLWDVLMFQSWWANQNR
jgi:asparagine synthase (glutamine-hydrolysing)